MNWFSFKGAVQLLTNVIDDKTVDFNIRLAIAIVLARLPQPTILQLAGEIWRDIRGYEGHYQVSNFGRVKSLKYGREIILKPGKNGGGYSCVALSKNGHLQTYVVHRLVAQAFLPNPDNLPQVDHLNEIKTDNRVENLQWVTGSENTKRTYQHGRKPVRAKVTFEQVSYIRNNPDNLSKQQLAEKFNVSAFTIRQIQLKQTWKV